jgi:hypothetical protein
MSEFRTRERIELCHGLQTTVHPNMVKNHNIYHNAKYSSLEQLITTPESDSLFQILIITSGCKDIAQKNSAHGPFFYF